MIDFENEVVTKCQMFLEIHQGWTLLSILLTTSSPPIHGMRSVSLSFVVPS